jgi:hypothetical protein
MIYSSTLINNRVERYTDTISGEELYVDINRDGNTFYFKDKAMNILHRRDGPACEYADGTKEWYVDGKLHRIDGPAIEYANGSKQWYVDGVFIMMLDNRGKITRRME